ncbi:DUF5320 domain-containing protein [Pelotomaculum propionicicum]|uniref:DUF5320 domain-containing protein n=1 Tax=Pelotomaculum propionicicum TaxID=258475 RepID=UPI003B7AFD33
MPTFNGTGPLGAGPMTGRGGGYCMSYVGPGARSDQSFCRGGGRGRRHWFRAAGVSRWSRWDPDAAPVAPVYAPPLNGEQEMCFLKEQAENMENAIEQIKNRIKELEKKD